MNLNVVCENLKSRGSKLKGRKFLPDTIRKFKWQEIFQVSEKHKLIFTEKIIYVYQENNMTRLGI